MKKIISAILLAVASIGAIQAQQNQADSVVYLIGTSVPSDELITGFIRHTLDAPDDPHLRLGPVYFFHICSKEKDVHIMFYHCNFNLIELAKIREVFPDDTMETLIRPKSELASYTNVVDVNQLIATKTQAEMWAWANSLARKKIYIIDRNDFFTENGVEKMKLIEVGLDFTNEPYEDDDNAGVPVE